VFNGLVRNTQRNARRHEVVEKLSAIEPKIVYGGLLHHAISRGWKTGSAFYAFEEIFSAPPRPQDRRVEPTPLPAPDDSLIAEWFALRPKKKSRKRKPRPHLPLFQGSSDKRGE
jgi:hypothetical protein